MALLRGAIKPSASPDCGLNPAPRRCSAEDLLEARPYGRLLRHDPATGETEVLLQGLYFANGVALSRDEDFVLVNETYRYRITRYWLTGARAGTSDIFCDNLPGFADGVSSNRRGTFWVAIFTVRTDTRDKIYSLQKGAYDYITKPFTVAELTERVRRIFQLLEEGGSAEDIVGGLEAVDD